MSSNGLRCPVEAAKEHVFSNPEVPSGQRNRESERERGSAVLVGYTAEEYVLHKAGTRSQVQMGSSIFLFMQFLQTNFSVSDKDEGCGQAVPCAGREGHGRTSFRQDLRRESAGSTIKKGFGSSTLSGAESLRSHRQV